MNIVGFLESLILPTSSKEGVAPLAMRHFRRNVTSGDDVTSGENMRDKEVDASSFESCERKTE